MASGFKRRAIGGAMAAFCVYPILTAQHLQNLLSGTAMFLLGVAIFIWGWTAKGR